MFAGALPWDFALIAAVLGIAVPWRGAVRVRRLLARPQLTTSDRLALYASTIAFQWLAAGVVAWRATARGLTTQQLALTVPDAGRAIVGGIALCLVLGAAQLYSLRRLARTPPKRQSFLHEFARKIMPQNMTEGLAFFALVVTVALCEEFLYRGFIFAVAENVFGGSAVFALLISSALFGLAHLYQGKKGLVSTFVVGTLFAGARLATGSLAPAMIAHLLTDLLAGLASGKLAQHADASEPQGQATPATQSNAEKVTSRPL